MLSVLRITTCSNRVSCILKENGFVNTGSFKFEIANWKVEISSVNPSADKYRKYQGLIVSRRDKTKLISSARIWNVLMVDLSDW